MLKINTKNKILFIISVLALLLSCEKEKVEQFDAINGQSLIQFDTNLTNVNIEIGKETTIEISINVSTRSNVDRIIKVGVPGINKIPADRFSFNKEVVIPANQFRGVLILTIKDSGINNNPDEVLYLKVLEANIENSTIANKVHTVNISQSCPIPDDFFIGTYILNSPITQGDAFCSDPRPTIIGNNIEVEVTIGVESNQRIFKARYAPGSCDSFSSINDFVLELSCNTVELINQIDTSVSFTGINNLIGKDPNNISNFSLSDDDVISFNIINDINGITSEGPFENQTIVLTKKCEIPSTFFTGTYILNSPLTQGNAFCSDPRPTIIGNNIEVEVTIGVESNQRIFKARYAPGSCDSFSSINDFVLELSCNTVELINQIDTSVSFTGINNLIGKDPNNISNYSLSDDNVISFNIINDINGVTSEGPFENQTITLTKR